MDMKLLLLRKLYQTDCVIGELYVNGNFQCFTLEIAAPIISGTYGITLYNSPKLKEQVALLQNVPGHDYIEIHPGNTPSDSHGCILVGTHAGTHSLDHSRDAFEILMSILQDAKNTGERINIEIRA